MSGGHGSTPFPKSLPASREKPSYRYRLVKTHVTVHGQKQPVDAKDATLHFAAENIAVHPAAKLTKVAIGSSDSVTPVYELSEGGSLAVPTGWIYLRLATPMKLNEKAAELRAAGYRIVRTLSHAPNAGWVTGIGGGIASSLNGIGKLDAIPGIEEVAPQMLSRAARKG